MITEEMINKLLDSLLFVENMKTRKVILNSFIKKYGEIPNEYKDAINVIVEM